MFSLAGADRYAREADVNTSDRYPKYGDNVCSELFLSQEQKHFRSCCP